MNTNIREVLRSHLGQGLHKPLMGRVVVGAWAIEVGALAVAMAALSPAGARADIVQTGYLFTSGYGRSELDRFLYNYNQTTNRLTGVTPYGMGGNTSSAYFLGCG